MKKLKFTLFEILLYSFSVTAIIISFIFLGEGDYLTLIASIIGATALILIAKGYFVGQILIIIFALIYGVISYFQRYYGELITYVCMSAPMAVIAMISWIKNPYKKTAEVKVAKPTKKQIAIMLIFTVLVTVAFYFILGVLNNANLIFSTISVTTSFVAVYLTYLRSPYYALAYAANDVILIVLWVTVGLTQPRYILMVICFIVFLINDLYGFVSWLKMQKRQTSSN
ncbi:MAG: nicotinamide mononucleotide transporter [Clostridia bacterium]|nr:nicotinamide mononucleotide transporter [Clostridia bacterium]